MLRILAFTANEFQAGIWAKKCVAFALPLRGSVRKPPVYQCFRTLRMFESRLALDRKVPEVLIFNVFELTDLPIIASKEKNRQEEKILFAFILLGL